jgi:hypothetical protein
MTPRRAACRQVKADAAMDDLAPGGLSVGPRQKEEKP